eukprot:g956.t1
MVHLSEQAKEAGLSRSPGHFAPKGKSRRLPYDDLNLSYPATSPLLASSHLHSAAGPEHAATGPPVFSRSPRTRTISASPRTRIHAAYGDRPDLDQVPAYYAQQGQQKLAIADRMLPKFIRYDYGGNTPTLKSQQISQPVHAVMSAEELTPQLEPTHRANFPSSSPPGPRGPCAPLLAARELPASVRSPLINSLDRGIGASGMSHSPRIHSPRRSVGPPLVTNESLRCSPLVASESLGVQPSSRSPLVTTESLSMHPIAANGNGSGLVSPNHSPSMVVRPIPWRVNRSGAPLSPAEGGTSSSRVVQHFAERVAERVAERNAEREAAAAAAASQMAATAPPAYSRNMPMHAPSQEPPPQRIVAASYSHVSPAPAPAPVPVPRDGPAFGARAMDASAVHYSPQVHYVPLGQPADPYGQPQQTTSVWEEEAENGDMGDEEPPLAVDSNDPAYNELMDVPWFCPFQCGKSYRSSSLTYIRRHLLHCIRQPNSQDELKSNPELIAAYLPVKVGKRFQKKRRKAMQLDFQERWNCPFGCGKYYRRTSTKSIQGHMCEMMQKRGAPGAAYPALSALVPQGRPQPAAAQMATVAVQASNPTGPAPARVASVVAVSATPAQPQQAQPAAKLSAFAQKARPDPPAAAQPLAKKVKLTETTSPTTTTTTTTTTTLAATTEPAPGEGADSPTAHK